MFIADYYKFEKKTFSFADFAIIACLLSQDFGTLGLPLVFVQFIIVGIFFIFVATAASEFSINRKLFFLLCYMLLFSLCFMKQSDQLRHFAYFVILITTIYRLLCRIGSFERLCRDIYIVALILATYGLIQQITYFIGIPAIYDLSLYGFAKNNPNTIKHGLLALDSLYSEPAHCCAAVAWGVWIGLIGEKMHFEFTSRKKTLIILVFGVLTQSAFVYSALATVFVLFYSFFYGEKNLLKKLGMLFLFAIVFLLIYQNEIVVSVFSKYKQFETLNTDNGNDLSALAIASNWNIAVEKFKDGFYLGTGFWSHGLYYDYYVKKLYGFLFLYLNNYDAGSLYTRVFSEFGIVGLLAMIYLIVSSAIKSIKNQNIKEFTPAVLFGITILRNGQYEDIFTVITFLLLFCKEFNYDMAENAVISSNITRIKY